MTIRKITKAAANPLVVRRTVVAAALFLTLGSLFRLLFDAIVSPSPLNLFAAEVILFVLLGIAIYVRLGNVDIEDPPRGKPNGLKRSHFLGLGCSYTLTLAGALLLLWQSVYVPSPLYYLALALAIAIVAFEIVHWSSVGERRTVVVLLQIVAIGVLIQISFSWLNPKSVFSDLYFDWLGIEAIAESGKIPDSLGYFFYFPSFHVLNAVVVQVGGIGINSYTLFNHFLMIVGIPVAYLLAREIVSPQKALASALLLVISLFFFLTAAVLPVLLGANLMLLASYALMKYRNTARLKWWGIFWVVALFVFFSHPVNALILAIILSVFWLSTRIHRTATSIRRLASPTATYGVAYLAYLGFIAINAFTILLQSFFESGPKIYFARTVPGPVPVVFVLQTVTSTLGLAILFLPGTIAILSWLFKGDWRHRLVLGTIAVLASVPAITVLLGRGPYGLQAARALLYISVFLVVPAASGLLYLARKPPRTTSRFALVAIVLFVVAFLSSTSYLTGSGNRFLSDSIPVQTSYATGSMLATRDFLDRIPGATPLTLDPAIATFLAPHSSGLAYPVTAYPIEHSNLVNFPTAFGNTSVALALSNLYLANSGYEAPDTSFIDVSYAVRAYDNGMVRVYAPLGG